MLASSCDSAMHVVHLIFVFSISEVNKKKKRRCHGLESQEAKKSFNTLRMLQDIDPIRIDHGLL